MNRNTQIFDGKMEKLRQPERIKKLEIPRVVETALKNTDAHSLLDIGTGTGLFAEAFIKAGLQVTGIDSNEKMVTKVRDLVTDGHFETASFDAVPFAAKTFDVSFFSYVLHESKDLDKTLREAIRVTRQRIVIQDAPFREDGQRPPLAHRFSPAMLITATEAMNVRNFSMQHFEHSVIYILEGF